MKAVLLIILFIWGIPSTYFRSKFRKIVYKTNDWRINIKPLFKIRSINVQIIALMSNIEPYNSEYIKIRNIIIGYIYLYI